MKKIIFGLLILTLFLFGCVAEQGTITKEKEGITKSQAESIAKNKIVEIIGRGSYCCFYENQR